MPRPIRIIIFNNTRLLLDNLSPGASARHSRTQEDVDDQHDEEEDAQSDGQPQQPRRMHASVFTEFWDQRRLAGVQDEHAGRCHEYAFVGGEALDGGAVWIALWLGTGTFAEAYITLKEKKIM